MWQAWDLAVDISLSQLPNILERNVQYNASSFFEEQLTAFEVWLKYGGEKRPPPEQVMIDMPVESENTPRGSRCFVIAFLGKLSIPYLIF